ncbi:pimeloyl-ACP methyl ester carboxylesterase [Litorivivens lipolytica]|uniref:Pimeloyl-ACP methyl ester carboxylesterase n=1 Tax=Litorivivens lipolytica TaxID=1524264 RepID=A0A7W4W397_9GAMM|nr:CocE/NonD family hydrolase [Litorivivens lipolytica]MBB3046646.1 pimeloyl-ACP methyl ester carboxylesterase [Litorivivens lipolytica]
MKRVYGGLGILGLAVALSACGGGSSSSGGGSPGSGGGASSSSGQFVDGLVKGLSYRRNGGDEVFQTSATGSFTYLTGETLTFFLGKIELGEVDPSAAFVSPKDFGDTATAIAQFLQTLDADSNPENGIQLSEAVRAAADAFTGTVDFSTLEGSDLETFATTANGEPARTLVSAADAEAHLNASLADIEDGRVDYDGGVDTDSDGVNDAVDKCPATPGDENFAGCPDSDALAADDDGDTIANGSDNCPATPNADQLDTDGDLRGDACDRDDDNDGLLDEDEANLQTNPTLSDTDFDGVGDGDDNCPVDANAEQTDTDRDGQGNVCDEDDDNDGANDDEDAFPLDPSEDTDTDGDGTGNNKDEDDDNDGVNDDEDDFPLDDSETTDTDGDGVGNNEDDDDDGDGVKDEDDAFPEDKDNHSDADNDGLGDETADACHETPANEQVDARGCSASQSNHASCVGEYHLAGGRSYQVTLTSATKQTISFQVFEPATFDCDNVNQGAHPLALHGHGFGGLRLQEADQLTQKLVDAGYAVISIDQRGFGDSEGTVRVMDPDFEGKDLVQILDWAEEHLDYLAWRNDSSKEFVARPADRTSISGGDNLLAGAYGSSYGGGYQLLLHAVDPKDRLDALAPDITWHDLRYSLNPGDTLKTAWDLLLVAGGEGGSYVPGLTSANPQTVKPGSGLDPYIRETLLRGASTNEFPRNGLEWFRYHSPTYWCDLRDEPSRPYSPHAGTLNNNLNPDTAPGNNTRASQRPVDVLLTQGFRDALFNFNDAWWNYQCLSERGGDVRLLTHQSGHNLQDYVDRVDGFEMPPQITFQRGSGNKNCGQIDREQATIDWFNEKLKGLPASDMLAETNDGLCLSLEDGDAIMLPAEHLLATRSGQTDSIGTHAYPVSGVSVSNIPNGVIAQQAFNAGQEFSVYPIAEVSAEEGLIVAGIPLANLVVTTPIGASDAYCAGSDETARTGCDSITYIGLGVQRNGSETWQLIDDQIMPIRGLGNHLSIEMVGIAERLAKGDRLGLLVYGYHPQYLASFSRDASIAAVNLSGDLQLPLYQVDQDGAPILDQPADTALSPITPDETVCSDCNNGYGTGVIGVIGAFGSDMNQALTLMLSGDYVNAQGAFETAFANLGTNLQALGASDPSDIPALIGLHTSPEEAAAELVSAERSVEPIILTGDKLPQWSVPAAFGYPEPYPSGADTEQCPDQLGGGCEAYDPLMGNLQDGGSTIGSAIRNAHNGTMLHPAGWTPGADPAKGKIAINQIVAWSFIEGEWREIPVQVDERMPYFLANANSSFSFYSGTDEELTYVWRSEGDPEGYFGEEVWGMTEGECVREYDPNGWDTLAYDPLNPDNVTNPPATDRMRGLSAPVPDPISGLDYDDEIVFMASDAGEQETETSPPNTEQLHEVRVVDPLAPDNVRFVYLGLRTSGSSSVDGYISYVHDPFADQWIDRRFFTDDDPEKLGSSNTGYGPNLTGTVCDGYSVDQTNYTTRSSTDRFTRDGVTVTTDTYQWYASGRWMVRSLKVREPGNSSEPTDWTQRPDLIDRWKGRAFQQSPDSTISLVGFEDEQVNWEANAALLGERCGPVRCIRETWGADSGTNVTKTETFYRDVITYRYRVRVHPIPSDGLYTSWDYNRSSMLPDPGEAVEPGRYFTALRPQGVPIDGINDDFGQIDSLLGQPAFFDTADPTFNLPLAFDNWEQISGKGNSGSLVYSFELKGATSAMTPVVVPYYRDDACLDDGTGDDPVARPWPGEDSTDPRVNVGYEQANGGTPYDQLRCDQRQGAFGAHGIHYFFTGDVDNAFVLGKPINEIDGQQWQFMVPTQRPENKGTPYANVVRAPLQTVVTPLAALE